MEKIKLLKLLSKEEKDEVELKQLNTANSLTSILRALLIEKLNINTAIKERLYVNVIWVNELVFNHYYYGGNENTNFDRYYKIGYQIVGSEVQLVGEPVEVEAQENVVFNEKKAEDSEIEYKTFSFEMKASDDNTFEGMASTFGYVDDGDDEIMAGAFTETLANRGKRNVKMLFQHDINKPIGMYPEIKEEMAGLVVKGKISQTTLGKDVKILMKDGVINELSIGYVVEDYEMVKKDDRMVRQIKKLKLYEISPVVWGMNDQTEITNVKSLENIKIEKLEKELSEQKKAVTELILKFELLEKKVHGELELETKEEPPIVRLDISELTNEIKKLKTEGKK